MALCDYHLFNFGLHDQNSFIFIINFNKKNFLNCLLQHLFSSVSLHKNETVFFDSKNPQKGKHHNSRKAWNQTKIVRLRAHFTSNHDSFNS